MLRYLKTIMAGLAILAAALASPALAAKPVMAEQQQIMQILKKKGVNVELKYHDGDKDAYLLIKPKDFYTYSIYFNGCDDEGKNCNSIQFYAGFEPAKMPSADEINTYNREHRFGRAFLDDEGYPAMRWEVNMFKGISEELFLDSLELWDAMLEIYGDFLFGKDGSNNKSGS